MNFRRGQQQPRASTTAQNDSDSDNDNNNNVCRRLQVKRRYTRELCWQWSINILAYVWAIKRNIIWTDSQPKYHEWNVILRQHIGFSHSECLWRRTRARDNNRFCLSTTDDRRLCVCVWSCLPTNVIFAYFHVMPKISWFAAKRCEAQWARDEWRIITCSHFHTPTISINSVDACAAFGPDSDT